MKQKVQSRIHVLQEISLERQAQDGKWGEQNHLPIEWMSILMEEVGEASKEALEMHFAHMGIVATEEKRKKYRQELIQVAAVAVSMIECLDRNQSK